MADLIDDSAVDDFRQAMRDVADTFNRYPVILHTAAAGAVELLAGKAPLSSTSAPDGLTVTDEGEEVEEGYQLRFNRDYLAEKGLISEDGDLLLDYDDSAEVDGLTYGIAMIDSTGTFRDADMNVVLKVVR